MTASTLPALRAEGALDLSLTYKRRPAEGGRHVTGHSVRLWRRQPSGMKVSRLLTGEQDSGKGLAAGSPLERWRADWRQITSSAGSTVTRTLMLSRTAFE
jgi:hypothetical protein